MSEIKRVSVSLRFADNELYNDLIVPMQKSRSLTSFIEGVLKAYFENEGLRNLIDNLVITNPLDLLESQIRALKEANMQTMIATDNAKGMMNDFADDMKAIAPTKDAWSSSIERRMDALEENSKKIDEILKLLSGGNVTVASASANNVGVAVVDVPDIPISNGSTESLVVSEANGGNVVDFVKEPTITIEKDDSESSNDTADNGTNDNVSSAFKKFCGSLSL